MRCVGFVHYSTGIVRKCTLRQKENYRAKDGFNPAWITGNKKKLPQRTAPILFKALILMLNDKFVRCYYSIVHQCPIEIDPFSKLAGIDPDLILAGKCFSDD